MHDDGMVYLALVCTIKIDDKPILLSSYCFVNLPEDGVIKSQDWVLKQAGWAARENLFALLAALEERLLCVAQNSTTYNFNFELLMKTI